MNSKHHIVIGSGPLGQATAEALARLNKKVLVLDRSGQGANIAGVRHLKLDVLQTEAAIAALPEIESIYQCSQPPYSKWKELFPTLQEAVVKISQQKKAKLVVAENLYMFGAPKEIITENSVFNPLGKKGETRAAMHLSLMTLAKQGLLNVNILRASDFYGPHVKNSMLGDRFFNALMNRKAVNYMGDLNKKHAVTYINDFGASLALVGTQSHFNSGEVWNVPSESNYTVKQIFDTAAGILKTQYTTKKLSRIEIRALGLFIPDVAELLELHSFFEVDYLVDDSKFRKAFKVEATRLETGLESAARWNFNQAKKI